MSQTGMFKKLTGRLSHYFKEQRNTMLIGVLITLCVLTLEYLAAESDSLKRINGLIYDTRLNMTLTSRQTETNIVVIDIDERSLEAEGRWPWSRVKVAKMIENLAADGAVVVAFDGIFTEPERNPVETVVELLKRQHQEQSEQTGAITSSVDLQLAQMIEQYAAKTDADAIMAESLQSTDVVLGMLLSLDSANQVGTMPQSSIVFDFDSENEDTIIHSVPYIGYVNNIPILQENSPGTGFINSNPEKDGFIRTTSLIAQYKGKFYPSLALEAARLYALADEVQVVTAKLKNSRAIVGLKIGRKTIPTNEYGQVLIPYKGPAKSFAYYSATDVLHGNFPADTFDSAIAFIGTSAVGNADLRTTPVGLQYPGVEVHANVADGILHPEHIPSVPDWAQAAILALILLLGMLLSIFLPALGPLTIALMGMLMISIFIWFDFYLWQNAKISLAMATIHLLIILLTIHNIVTGYLQESGKRKQIKGIFDQYVPPAHIDKMLADPESLNTAGEKREMTVLFSDIRSFTTISEQLTASDLANLLNRYFSPITKSIFEHQGTIDKYVGDMVMAFWNAPLHDEKHVENAIKCAFEMLEITEVLTKEFEKEGWPAIHVGVGINTGEMNVGDMGSEYRRAYTVLGDAVNLGSRLEGLTKFYGVDLLVNETCVAQCPDMTFKLMDKVRVKGKHEAVSIYEPIKPDRANDPQVQQELDLYQQAYDFYLQQDWTNAREKFSQLAGNNPDTLIYSIYLERIEILQHESLDANWDGSFTHTSK